MNKSELKNGMVIKTRDNCIFNVSITENWRCLVWYVDGNISIFNLDDFNDDLTYKGFQDNFKEGDQKADICEVYSVPVAHMEDKYIEEAVEKRGIFSVIESPVKILWKRHKGE